MELSGRGSVVSWPRYAAVRAALSQPTTQSAKQNPKVYTLVFLSRLKSTLLQFSIIYNSVQYLFLANNNRKHLFNIININKSNIIIDIGCGTSEIIDNITTNIKYIGVDENIRYVKSARKKFGARGAWFVGDASSVRIPSGGQVTFLLLALLHHLDDHTCETLLRYLDLLRLQSPGARIVVVDPCVSHQQSWIWEAITRADRGKFIRTEEAYVQLLEATGLEWSVTFHKHIILPYYYCIGILAKK